MSIFSKMRAKKHYALVKSVAMTICISAIVSIIVCCFCSGAMAKKAINKDPKFIVDAINNMYQQEQQKQQEASTKKAPEIAKKIVAESKSIIGNKNGSKLVVEFFDYNCGHCKRQTVELKKLIGKNKDVKIVLVDMPILSANSLIAAQVGVYLAQYYPNKLEGYYNEMAKTQADPATIKSTLKSLKIDAGVFEKAKKDEKVRDIIEKNYGYAKELGLQGTPALIIGGKFVGGMISADQIESMLR